MSASTPQDETPIKPGSNKLSRPFKAEVLRHHIQKAITHGNFRLLSGDSDSDQRFRLDRDPETFQKCSSYVSAIQAIQKSEYMIYKPLAKLLTEISRFVHRMQVKESRTSALTPPNSLIMFITRANSVQKADDGEAIRPDIAGVEATAEEVAEYLQKDGLPPDRFSYLHWSRLVSVGEVKLTDVPEQWKEADMLQVLSYVWCANRYQPNRFIHTALLAFRTGFITLQYHPDTVTVSTRHLYSDIQDLVQYVYDVYYPGGATSTPSEFTNLKPIQRSPHEPKINTVTTLLKPNFRYTVQGDEANEYSIFDLFHGSGFGRQAYVGLGAKTTAGGGSPQIIVLKVYCRDVARRFKEEDIIRKIHGDSYLPGVPRICEDSSEKPFELTGFHAQDPVREACMISLASTGESLSMCKNVLQFLKAMYDLTEVHRILVERKHILHRDISWGNILINHTHFKGPDEDVGGFGFIDKVLGELEPKVQVLLTDFDNAMIIQEAGEGKHEHDGTKSSMHPGITGTPAFIAEVLARRHPAPIEIGYIPWLLQGLNNVNIAAHPLKDRRISDVEFFKEVMEYTTFDPTQVSHQAIHDAESIFWVIVFFMIRANPKGSDGHRSIEDRSKIFDAIVGHVIGGDYGSRTPLLRFTAKVWTEMLPEKLHRFSGTLVSLSRYFSFPWHGIQVPVKHQFHAHNFLQRWLIAEIRQLTELKDPIQLELVPLPVRSELDGTQLTSDLKSLAFQSTRKRSHTEDVGTVKRRKQEQSQAEDDCAPSAATDVFTGEARDVVVTKRVTSYEILQSNVRDSTTRKVIQDVRTSHDIQKMWFTGSSMSHFATRPLIKPLKAH